MSSDLTTELQRLLVRFQAGDPAARKELINRVYPRLYHLAGKILHESFPRLGADHNSSDIANELSLRLYEALEKVQLTNLAHFFRLAAQRVRWILLDLARKPGLPREDRPPPEQAIAAVPAGSDSDLLPGCRKWARLHELVEQLPDEEREVVDLRFYVGLEEAEAAEQLQVCPRTIRRRWNRAKWILHKALKAIPEWESFFDENEREE
jgi:RNA polymerase sigma factor (TIGR02999 family)